MKSIYLDYAAATPIDEKVMAAMRPYYTTQFYNPSALYGAAVTVRKDIDRARGEVASVLGVRPAEIIFTAGGTEANNLAIHGVMGQYPTAHMVVSAIEHDSVRLPAQLYGYSEAPVNRDGIIDLDKFKDSITDQTVLVSLMYANNEIGTIQPIAQVAHLIKEVRHERMTRGNKLPIYLHSDACQAANYLHIYANTLGVDLMTINSGKIYGPKQCGALFNKNTVDLKPQLQGGGQEHGQRSGTENVAGIIGFATALVRASDMREAETKRVGRLQQMFMDLVRRKMPQAQLNGSGIRLANNVHLTLPGQDNERLIYALDDHGIQCAAGSACSASKDEPSYTLSAIGVSDADARSSLRFTMGRGTNEEAVIYTVDTLAKLVA